jgi:hypothetical protein
MTHTHQTPFDDLSPDKRPAIREMVKFANDLINHRLTWFGTLQGLLLTALTFAWKHPPAGILVYVLCSIGLLVALSTGIATRDANKTLEQLETRFSTLGYDKASAIETLGVLESDRSKLSGWLMPGRFLPWLFFLGWLVILAIFVTDSYCQK